MSDGGQPHIQSDTQRVGSLYHPDHTSWPPHVEYTWHEGRHSFTLFLPRLTNEKSDKICRGSVELCVTVHKSVIFVISKFVSLPWTAHPYCLSPPAVPIRNKKVSHSFSATFVDASTGLSKAARLTSMGSPFARLFDELVAERATTPRCTYELDLAEANALYPDPTERRHDALASYKIKAERRKPD